MSSPRLDRFAALLIGALAIGCSSDSSVAPTVTTPDLSSVLKELSSPVFGGGTLLGSAAMPRSPTPSGCSYAASSQSFVCPTVSVNGVSFAQSYVLLDAGGKPQSQWSNTIAAVRMKTSAAGSTTSAGTSDVFDLQQELTLSGLLSGVHTLDGTSMLKTTTGAGTTLVTTTMSTTMTGLVLPDASAGAAAYPKSGSVTATVTTTTGGRTSMLQMQMTFNGTSKVAVVFTIEGVTTRCTIDLASSNPACA